MLRSGFAGLLVVGVAVNAADTPVTFSKDVMPILEAIESQLSAFVGAKVEISGQVKRRTGSAPGEGHGNAPTLQVEFVQKIAAACP